MACGTVDLYASTPQARLEVTGLARRVSTQEGGRIVGLRVELGREVTAGEILVELDTTVEQRQLDEARARVASLEPRVEALRRQSAAERAARDSRFRLNATSVERAKGDLEAARIAAARQEKLGAISERLSEEQLLSKTDKLKAEGEVADTAAKLAAAKVEISRIEASQRYDDQQEAVRIAELGQKLAELEAERSASVAQVETATAQIERRKVRAPATGKLGNVTPLQIGDVLKASDVIAIVVPPQEVHVVAELPPSEAVGRVLPGQSARVRLDGFAWTQFGMLDATVTHVASEPHDGTVRVELVLRGDLGRIPIQHGLPGAVDIQVERVTPWTLLLRSTGSAVTPASAPSAARGAPVAVAP